MKILIVDDGAASRESVSRTVRSFGHDCIVAEDGGAAWALYQGNTPDVVISDWMMPVLNGLDLCRLIRSAPARGNYSYFVLMTARDEKENVVQAMEAGADDFLRKPVDSVDLQAVIIAAERVTRLHRQLGQQRSELETLNGRFFEEGRIDPLTRINNRLRLNEDLEALMARSERYGHVYGLALCDVDFFKAFNDSQGHLQGDEVLRQVAQTLQTTCRSGDAVYRYGGEEFVLIFPEQGMPGALTAAERHRMKVMELAIPHPNSPLGVITISVGVTTFSPKEKMKLAELLSDADRALYEAKGQGRNKVVHRGRVASSARAGPDPLGEPPEGDVSLEAIFHEEASGLVQLLLEVLTVIRDSGQTPERLSDAVNFAHKLSGAALTVDKVTIAKLAASIEGTLRAPLKVATPAAAEVLHAALVAAEKLEVELSKDPAAG